MKKMFFVFGCVLVAATVKAQSQNTVVYIPATSACYLSSGTSTSSNGQTLTLSIYNAIGVEPTRDRLKMANDCQRGEFINDNTQGGTHNVDCDVTVNATCFCTGVK